VESTRTICIGNLPLWVTAQNLEELSSTLGRVLSARVVESADGLPLGYGFVEMENGYQAIQAKQMLHGAKHFGGRLCVSTYVLA
jgi:RNA recognition motif-containing protein